MKTINILVIEDSIQDYLILREYINRIDSFNTELVHCESVSAAECLLKASKYDLIFLDLFLSDTFGRESFLQLKQLERYTPIVVLSGLTDKSTALEIVQLGAQEYIVKGDFDELLIEKAIIYSIERQRFQQRVQISEERHRLTFKNAGVALGEYDARELYDFIQNLKQSGIKHASDYPIDNMQKAMEIREKISMVMVNDEALRLFEMNDKQDFSENYIDVHTLDSVVILQNLFNAIWYENDSFEVIAKYKRRKSDQDLVLLSRVSIFGFEEKKCSVIKSGTDISELILKEKQIARQNNLAEALSNSTMALLEEGPANNQLVKALGLQAEALGVDYVSIIKIERKQGKEYLFSHENWTRKDEYTSSSNYWIYETSIEDLGISEETNKLFADGAIRVKTTEDLPKGAFKELLKTLKIKSIHISPIFVKSSFWAAVLYVNYENEREWKDEEHINIKLFSNSIGSFIARNNVEMELLELNEQLESRIQKRTQDLTEAMEELESFSYSVSHDLRAPLRKVGGFSQILEKEYSGELPERAKHLMNNIKDGAHEMSQLIHDLLEFSKLGRQKLSFSDIDMNNLCQGIINDTVALYPSLNINMSLNSLENAKGDRNLVKQAISNLVWNAVKFSSKNELIEIQVDCTRQGSMNIYSVTDNGIGIDMKYADKVFSVFQRLHTKEQYEGTGVGLALVKRIIKKHNGKVTVQGELGKGATFSFSLPASSKNAVTPPAKNPVSIQ
ncbi:MAG: ATP-binding protein [Flavobacteriales bacterium]